MELGHFYEWVLGEAVGYRAFRQKGESAAQSCQSGHVYLESFNGHHVLLEINCEAHYFL